MAVSPVMQEGEPIVTPEGEPAKGCGGSDLDCRFCPAGGLPDMGLQIDGLLPCPETEFRSVPGGLPIAFITGTYVIPFDVATGTWPTASYTCRWRSIDPLFQIKSTCFRMEPWSIGVWVNVFAEIRIWKPAPTVFQAIAFLEAVLSGSQVFTGIMSGSWTMLSEGVSACEESYPERPGLVNCCTAVIAPVTEKAHGGEISFFPI